MRHRALGLALIAALTAAPLRADDPPFPPASAADVGIDAAALDRLKTRAEKSGSDSVVVIKDGKLVADWNFGTAAGPIEAMSATKSIVNLAVGRLIDQGKIQSLDQPVSDYYNEWRQGRKAKITIRHLLNHTSGIQNDAHTGDIYASPDFVQLALAAELSDDPGARFSYNNKAVNLLAGIIQKVSGKRMDVYIRDEIFAPLGIVDFTWTLDRAGNPQGMAGLQIRAIDLARIGQMMLDRGIWKGKRIVSEEWVRRSTGQAGQPFEPSCGLLWWLHPAKDVWLIDDAMVADLKEAGLTDLSVKKVEALKGKEFDLEGVWAVLRPILHADPVVSTKLKELDERLTKTGRPKPRHVISGEVQGFSAQGYLGQFLVVIPKHRLIAVRQFRQKQQDPTKMENLGDFHTLVQDLVPKKAPQ